MALKSCAVTLVSTNGVGYILTLKKIKENWNKNLDLGSEMNWVRFHRVTNQLCLTVSPPCNRDLTDGAECCKKEKCCLPPWSAVAAEGSIPQCKHWGANKDSSPGNRSDLQLNLIYLKNSSYHIKKKNKSHHAPPEFPQCHLSATLNKAPETPREREAEL